MTLFTARVRRLAFGGKGDVAADVPAVDHRVESTLQLTEFGAVEHHQIASQVALLDALEAPRVQLVATRWPTTLIENRNRGINNGLTMP
ncbi:hypothetical protein MGAST_15110 [Mycobacterium gastri 'Wayne']|uniref:Uncharacterized protein n=1 Tax=Mycobacterium gastri TaxID=1777 RepID=A0A1X1V9I3_MYCGS|nr:hypothetical protein MGAST_15110 [Mycobacterium gastri 'Wayne']ORV65682.1 hypothetical protein AWC07_13075 [Mycobacterium gastri]